MLEAFLAPFSDVLSPFLRQILYRELVIINCPCYLIRTFLSILCTRFTFAAFCMASGDISYHYILIKLELSKLLALEST